MEQLNSVNLRGRIGNVRSNVVGDKSVYNFSVATNCITRGSGDALMEETQWTNCVMWTSKRYPDLSGIAVGSAVEVKGRLRSNRYTGSDGVERLNVEVLVSEIEFIPENEKLQTPVL